MVMRHAKETLIVPKRIVGVESDGGKGGHGSLVSWHRCALSRLTPFYSIPMQRDPFLDRLCPYIVKPVQSSRIPAMPLEFSDLPLHPLQMSDRKDGDDQDTSVITKTRAKTQRPPLYKVLLLNDDYTPMEFVVHILERFFGLTHAQAFEVMLTVHKKGLAVVGVFSFEVAETKVAQVMDFARRHQHPLQCTLEKE
jgi:ATP-dependent Clp protease adaptor protein ClpS